MYRITLICNELPGGNGADVAADITAEFQQYRPWQRIVSCTWDGRRLTLRADSEHDESGMALLDEFGDCLVAYSGAHGSITVHSIVTL